jgi:hypothetical protein
MSKRLDEVERFLDEADEALSACQAVTEEEGELPEPKGVGDETSIQNRCEVCGRSDWHWLGCFGFSEHKCGVVRQWRYLYPDGHQRTAEA